jgi:hypothetical protein
VIGAQPVVPVTFNTGQILIGLAAGVRKFGGAYSPAMQSAAQWLVDTQDADGCWRKHPSPFTSPGEKVYDTHVAWGLLEAARVSGASSYRDAAIRNVSWALRAQHPNGWFERCCLNDSSQPLTHTLGYALRGILEAYVHTQDRAFERAAARTADGLLSALRADGFLPGRIGSDWCGRVTWCCLTGSAQIASCWLILFQHTGDPRYRDAAFAVNRYVRRTIAVSGAPQLRGGVKGSFPIDGEYGQFQFLNWACKFMLDANRLEREVRESA